MPWLDVLRWVVATPLFLLAVIATVGNAAVVVHILLGATKSASFVSLVGGLAGALGCLIGPGLLAWAWLPPLVDVGCVPILVYALAWRVWHGPPKDPPRGTPPG